MITSQPFSSMKLLPIFFVLVLVAAVTSTEDQQEWLQWKLQYSKRYDSNEETLRHNIWTTNKKYIEEHNENADKFGYKLKLNEYADLTSREFTKMYNGYLSNNSPIKGNTSREHIAVPLNLPTSVNWRQKGVVTNVKNQGNCGSCWAFSATGSLEGQHALKTGKLVSLSEQNLVDCVKKDDGCGGGLMIDAFEYIKENGGIDTEESYPYEAKNHKCRFKASDVGATLTGYVKIKKENCPDLKNAAATIGPISAAMDASHSSFQFYDSGIYNPKKCSETKLDHGVLVVGFGTENGVDYWLMKNSWGKRWGLQGYFKIAAKNNLCGICTSASYPVV